MKKIAFILLIQLLLSGFHKVNASHLLGGDITWTCVGQDSFIVKTVIFRDCNGIPPSNMVISFDCVTTNIKISSTWATNNSTINITPVCNNSCTRCGSNYCSFPYGIQKYTFQCLVNLSSAGSCCKIRIYTSDYLGDRSTSINLLNYGSMHLDAILDRCQNPCDNSPQFLSNPVGIFCLGQIFNNNVGAYDTDTNSSGGLSDSLKVKWTEPMQDKVSPLTYISGYSYKTPIFYQNFPYPTGMKLDSNTGDLLFRPMRAQGTSLSIKIEEYRNGNLLGYVRREIPLIIISCPTQACPQISTSGNINTKNVCPGDTVKFEFSTDDTNYKDTLNLSWSNSINGAQWTTTNGQAKHPSATLSWVPDSSRVSNLPYIFTVTVKDNRCPIVCSVTKTCKIYVNPIPRADISISDSGCGKYYFKAIPITGIKPTYKWSSDSFVFSPDKGSLISKNLPSGTYPVKLEMITPGCSGYFYDTVNVAPYMYVKLPADTSVCFNTTLNLQANLFNAVSPYQIQWGSGNTAFSNDTNLSKQITITKDTTLWIRASHGTYDCPYDEIKIKIYPKYKVSLPQDTLTCKLNYLMPTVFKPNDTAFASFSWYKQGSLNVIDTTPYLYVSDTGRFVIVAADSFGCIHSDSVHIMANPLLIAYAGDAVICGGTEAELSADTTGGGSAVYNWFEGAKLVGNTQNIKVKPNKTTDYLLTVSETKSGLTCTDSLVVHVVVNPFINANAPARIICFGNEAELSADSTGGGTAGYYWYDDTNLVGSLQHIKVKPDTTTNYFLRVIETINGLTCKDSMFVKVVVHPLPAPFAGLNDTICTGKKYKLKGIPLSPSGVWRGTGVEGKYPNWWFNPDTTGILDGGTYEAIYHFTDYRSCENEDTILITVFAMPKVNAGNPMDFCKNENAVNLYGSPSGGLWSGMGVIANQFYPAKVATGIYKLTYSYTNVKCTSTDTVNYTVHANPPKPVISLTPNDSFLECNLLNGSYEWNYSADSIANYTKINEDSRRINPDLYCKKCYYNVVYIDSNGCRSDTSDHFYYFVNSIGNIIPVYEINIYPNPVVSNVLTLEINKIVSSSFNITIHNSLGIQIIFKEVRNQTGFYKDQFYLPIKGVYFMKIDMGGKLFTRNVVVE